MFLTVIFVEVCPLVILNSKIANSQYYEPSIYLLTLNSLNRCSSFDSV